MAGAESFDNLATRDDRPRAERILVKRFDSKPPADKRIDNVAHRMMPFVRTDLVYSTRIGVVRLSRPAHAGRVVKIRHPGFKCWDFGRVLLHWEHPRDGVSLDDVEEPARLQVMRDDPAPLDQIGKPADHTIRSVNDVECSLCVEMRPQVVQIAANESAGDSSFLAQLTRCFDRVGGKVHARDSRPAARPRKRVEAKVTLQM